MADFKVLRGESSRISSDVTPIQDGQVYFTQDDGGLYIDTEEKRTRINPPSQQIAAILSAQLWGAQGEGYTQQIFVDELSADSNGTISLTQGVTKEQWQAACDANMRILSQQDHALTILALGDKPEIDIPVLVTIIY